MSILNHVVLGTNDPAKAAKFYDAAFAPLGIQNMGAMGETGILYGKDHPQFIIRHPLDGESACHANGGTIGFRAPSREAVDQFHAGGLANGGSDEGAPGPREFIPGSYGAYLRDPDGNKICAFHMS